MAVTSFQRSGKQPAMSFDLHCQLQASRMREPGASQKIAEVLRRCEVGNLIQKSFLRPHQTSGRIMSVFFIAEAGVNHNGDKDIAYRLIDIAVEAGADAVKFQTFNAEALASEAAPKAAYQNETTDAAESQLDMLRRLELKRLVTELRDYCMQKGIEFLSTPFDLIVLNF